MHPPSLPQWLSLAPQIGLSLPTSKVQAEAGRARLHAPGRGFSRAGACVGRKQGRDRLRGRCCDCPPMHPSQGESPRFEKGLSPQLRLPPTLPAWEAGLEERWGAQSRATGSPVFVHKRRPSGGFGICSELSETQFPTPKFTGLHAVGSDFRHPSLPCWRLPPGPPSVPRHTRTGLKARDTGGYKAGGEGRGR